MRLRALNRDSYLCGNDNLMLTGLGNFSKHKSGIIAYRKLFNIKLRSSLRERKFSRGVKRSAKLTKKQVF